MFGKNPDVCYTRDSRVENIVWLGLKMIDTMVMTKYVDFEYIVWL